MDDMYFDRQGKPIDRDTWVKKFGKLEYKRVASTEKDGINVSTIWLGMNHNWSGGEPLIFETMIFGGEHGGYQERYATEEQAIAGHKRAEKLAFGKGKK